MNKINKSKVEYNPINSSKKPFKYQDRWYNRDELKEMGLDKEASKAITEMWIDKPWDENE